MLIPTLTQLTFNARLFQPPTLNSMTNTPSTSYVPHSSTSVWTMGGQLAAGVAGSVD